MEAIMSVRLVQQLLLAAAIVGCGGHDTDAQQQTASSGSTNAAPVNGCTILTPADIRAVTGIEVHLIARGQSPGAGGTCGNYATAEGDAYLGVNALERASEYTASVSAVPEDVYPQREAVAGLGEEAVLMKDDTGMLRYLVARKGERGVVLFPLGRQGRAMSDGQLRQLAERALQ
jgi:hypothetical protein